MPAAQRLCHRRVPKQSFVGGEKADPVAFKLGAVSILLVNIEEEKLLRAADPHVRMAEDGLGDPLAKFRYE